MQKYSLYDVSIPLFIQYLSNLISIIEKAKKYSAKTKGGERKMLEGRLAKDMFTFKEQIGYSYFMALETTTNLSGIAAPELGYDESSLTELQSSLKKVIAFLKKCPKNKFTNAHKKRVTTFLHPGKKYSASTYVVTLAVPNFFFHVTTAYDILRHLGVPLKKDDYLGLK